jgi:DNA-directed RNA polymerase I and III subunit RPAC1
MTFLTRKKTQTTSFPGNYPHQDLSWNLDAFKKKLKLVITKQTEDLLVFDLIGVDAPIANALRRIMMAEVPTMAIEKVFVMKNTSIIQDEVLSHRLGLIPLRADATQFDMKKGTLLIVVED